MEGSLIERESGLIVARTPLTEAQFRELNNASLGISSNDSAIREDIKKNTVDRHRHELAQRLGATTMAHAVRIAIVEGILPIELDNDNAELSEQGYKILELISYGLTNDQIADKLGSHPVTPAREFKRIKDALRAKTRPHAVRRAFETSVFSVSNQQLSLHQS